jgi:hypothetical protein
MAESDTELITLGSVKEKRERKPGKSVFLRCAVIAKSSQNGPS